MQLACFQIPNLSLTIMKLLKEFHSDIVCIHCNEAPPELLTHDSRVALRST